MDGLATMGFVPIFGWGAMLAALPVLALQGSVTLACAQYLKPFLEAHSLVLDPLNATGGLLVFSVALVILELKKIELADYCPAWRSRHSWPGYAGETGLAPAAFSAFVLFMPSLMEIGMMRNISLALRVRQPVENSADRDVLAPAKVARLRTRPATGQGR